MADRSTDDLESFLAERGDQLLRTAVLLAGGTQAGEDLLQTAIERLLSRWRRFDGDPEGYLRRTMANLAIDGSRRRLRWHHKAPLMLGDLPPAADFTTAVDLRDALVRMLLQLPVRQRTVLVLRYFEQLSEAEITELLGWPDGTVKSTAHRAMKRLRELAVDWQGTAGNREFTGNAKENTR